MILKKNIGKRKWRRAKLYRNQSHEENWRNPC
nr:MAG TPA: hypothetical protein [Caudoviricetes sp.]DAS94348.1 MAG TPA: hypothetical protein [Caudoviricetes sp.]